MLHSPRRRGQRHKAEAPPQTPVKGPQATSEIPSSTPGQIALKQGLRIWAEVDLDIIEANVRALRAQAGDARLLAVIKANAYGHGAVPVGKAALAAGAWGLGVVSVDEGEVLRRAGIEAPILVLGATPSALAPRVVKADLRATIATYDEGVALGKAARRAGKRARVHLKVETGLHRFGAAPDEAVALAESLRALPDIEVEGVSTHLAAVDEGDKTFTYQQFEAFRQATERLPWVPLHHISSTGAILDLPDLRLGLVRTGIGIYGYYPSDEVQRSAKLRPALALRSRIARVHDVPTGDSVGYGRDWTAQKPSRVALVLAGYADGVRRVLSNKGVALVRSRRAPFAGRIAMDMLMLDVTDIPDAAVDDEVTLLGTQGSETVDADEVARLSNTISYEVLAGLMHRVTRLYVREGRIVAVEDLSGYRDGSA